MNEKLKSVKLGAPESISVNNCKTLENFDVQITERLTSLSFKGNTGTKNPFARAAELLKKDKEENESLEGIHSGANLQKEFLPVDYIVGLTDGTIINTNIPAVGHKLVCTFSLSSIPTCVPICGTNQSCCYGVAVYNGKLQICLSNSSSLSSTNISLSINKIYTAEINPDKVLNGTSYGNGTYTTTGQNIYVFRGYNSYYEVLSSVKIYSVKIYNTESNELVCSLVPCIHRISKETGMFDTVTQTFKYGTNGRKDFSYGKVLSDDFFELSIPQPDIINGCTSTTCTLKDGETILPARDYYWQITNVNTESTCTPTIDQRGNITMKSDKWAEFTVKVKKYFDASWLSKDYILGALKKYSVLSSKAEYVKNNFNDFYCNYDMLDYLNANNTTNNYIDSGITAESVESETHITFNTYNSCMFLGTGNTLDYSLGHWSGSIVYINGSCVGNTKAWSDSSSDIWKITSSTITIITNGVTKETAHSKGLPTSQDTIKLFRGYYSSSTRSSHLCEIHLCKLSKSGSVVWHGVPAQRKEDGVVGFYDMVNGVFHTNAGTGTFIYGDVITKGSTDYFNKL